MYHATLTQDKWSSLPLVVQLSHVGSEVGRAITWREKNSKYMTLAFYRALELLDLTMGDRKNFTGLKEIARIREFLVDYFVGEDQYGCTDVFWQKYFMVFTFAARSRS